MKIGFIGGGLMADSIIRGILKNNISLPKEISVGEIILERRKQLQEQYGITTFEKNKSVLEAADLIVISVKPQNLVEIFTDLKGTFKDQHTVISIVAGANINTLKTGFNHSKIIRVMPNMPAQIGCGMTVWTASSTVNQEHLGMTKRLAELLGKQLYVEEEKYIDMATALSASGPAYVFLFIEALIEAGVYIGMPRDMASTLVRQTVWGSSKLVMDTGIHPAELRNAVTSPGGTTAEALLALEENEFRAGLINAVDAAYGKAMLLGGSDDS